MKSQSIRTINKFNVTCYGSVGICEHVSLHISSFGTGQHNLLNPSAKHNQKNATGHAKIMPAHNCLDSASKHPPSCIC
eukprot:2697222-Amphidinium_carterae.1